MIDLHCHSNFSDGLLSPEELLQQAYANGVKVLALTDHDTTAGLAALHQAAASLPITIINGIELSAHWKKWDFHIIGLNISIDDKGLQALIKQQNVLRVARAQQISEQIQELGITDAYNKAVKLAGHERVGRLHFAQLLVAEGLVSNKQAAFKRFLGRGKPAYVPAAWPSLTEVVNSIVQANGQAVLAHPLKYALTRTQLKKLITAFKEAGGAGMEVVSGDMTKMQIQEMTTLCEQFQLKASTGSDYHGSGITRLNLGGQQPLPVNCIPIWQTWNLGQGGL